MIWIFRQDLYLLYKGLCLGLRVEMGGLSAVNQQAYLSRLKGGIIDTIFFPFYLLGLMVKKDALIEISSKRSLKAFSVAVLIAWFFCFYFFEYTYKLRGLFTGRNPFGSFSNEIILVYGGLFRLLCYIITIIIGFAVLCVVPKINLGFFSAFGQRTIQVYFWHPIFLPYLTKLIGNALVSSLTGKIIWILCAVAVAFITGMRIFSFPVKQIRENCRST